MKIINTRINGIEHPIGFRYDYVTCSWQVTETEAKRQVMAKVEVSLSPDFSEILYEKEGAGLNQAGEELEFELKPRTTYYYRVWVTAENGESAVSEPNKLETGKMDEPWQAEWIGMEEGERMHPVFSKTFSLKGKIKRARLYASGVGMFEAWLNGKKLGEEYLLPYLTVYEKALQVITFPAEEWLAQENTLEFLVGKGWYLGVFGLENRAENFGNRMAVVGELHLEYEDGTYEVLTTDESWQYRGSEIEDSGIYFGEIYNRLLWEGKENPWRNAVVLHPETAGETAEVPGKNVETAGNSALEAGPRIENLKKENLTDRYSLPVLEKEELTVKEVIHTPAGETVLDLGQNFAGIMEFTAELPKGTRIVLDFGEILQQGNFYNRNYRDALSRFVYVSNGQKERVRPHFTFFGFRYVRVTGWPGEVPADCFQGKVLYSDLTRTGFLTTGHEKINRLYENTVWGLKSNFLDIPTDCPQRSERLGWTGDAQVFAPTASYHMDTRAFYHKFLKDLMDEQEFLQGGVPNFLPNFGHGENVSSVWSDVATILPQTLYRYYGGKKELEFDYKLAKGWVDYVTGKDQERGTRHLYDFGMSFGDWLALDGATPTSMSGGTDSGYIGSVYYYNSARIVARMAETLGRTEDAKAYGKLAEEIRKATLREYFSESGRLAVNTQAAYVIALKFGVYREKKKILEGFKARLMMDCNQIKCGFVGAPLLCTILAENNMTELAYDFLLKEGFPSWLYSVNLGATTIWERWNSVLPDGTISDTGMNSLNHYSYGSVMEFMYGWIAGIRPATPGFGKAIIEPRPDIRLGHVQCRYDSVQGRYESSWAIREDGSLKVHVEIPFHCTALVRLPGYEIEEQELSAGSYDFCYRPARDFCCPYHEGTTLERLAKDEQALEILEKYVPAIAGMARSGDPEMGAKSFLDISKMPWLPFTPEALWKAEEEISRLRPGH